ncbi:TonB-dependent receptor [Corallincola luteus]|uniref:TonB-dependent receptor n=1 Tax=Corallincola luteus TaxID=1775177 RepID=A0ABY2AM28_9GAMM|nr:TonB-dependent receptor [Corallincola luteus]TCI04015.1 TonB-dependent receptor [Corallincola luteus]
MMNKAVLLPPLLATGLCLLSPPSYGETDEIEHIEVHGQRHVGQWMGEIQAPTPTPDVADWLKAIPGADVNKNGPVSGIAQYRGLYGDRVSVSVAGRPVVGAGPNAMDAPLSYAPAINTEQLQVFRGVAPVSAGMDTLGGAVSSQAYQADFTMGQDLAINGETRAGYQDNGRASDLAGRLHLSSQDHGAVLFVEDLYGRDDQEDGDGRDIQPTEYHKRSGGVDYRYRLAAGYMGGEYQYLDTKDAGTPALPMDIDYIRTHRMALKGGYQTVLGEVTALVGYTDADHVMDNYRLRQNSSPQRYRKTKATSDSVDWRLTLAHELNTEQKQTQTLLFGLDGVISNHDATITNPNNAMFLVENFNDVEDRRFGAFVEWQGSRQGWDWLGGARVKYVEADAGDIYHSAAMMNPNIGGLMQDFNQADKSVDDTLADIAFVTGYQLAPRWRGVVGLGIKQRAAAYQERYLWLPMQSTGGLADGKTYVGDINLDPETAWQIDLGLDYLSDDWFISPRVFYQRIDDYIQGTPVTDDAVLNVAAMMGAEEPLQFSNLDAELYGADLSWYGLLSTAWTIGGQATYIRGKRRDIDDNLYRIAPPNMGVYLQYEISQWQMALQWHGYAAQDDVSATNNEKTTAGYAIVGFELNYQWQSGVEVRAGVENLLDHAYQDHLAGYNRVNGSELALAERLPGTGRTVWLQGHYLF